MADGAPGRPSKLTPELQKRVFRMLRKGLGWHEVADIVGVDYVTLYRWRKAGQEEPNGEFGEFARGSKAAKSHGIRKIWEKHQLIAMQEGDLKALQWSLSVMKPERYATRARTELTGKNGKAVEVRDATMDDLMQDPKRLAAELRRRADAIEAQAIDGQEDET